MVVSHQAWAAHSLVLGALVDQCGPMKEGRKSPLLEAYLERQALQPQGFTPQKNYEVSAKDGGYRAFRHALVQVDEQTGEEYVLVHPCAVDYLEESGVGPLPWAESMKIIESLLGPAATPPHVLAFGWRPGDMVLWDNRCTHHAVSPTRRNQGGFGNKHGTPEPEVLFADLGERRLLFRTEMQPTWAPHLVGEAPAVTSKL